MNEQHHEELERLENRQRVLERDIAELAHGISDLKSKLKTTSSAQTDFESQRVEAVIIPPLKPRAVLPPPIPTLAPTLTQTAAPVIPVPVPTFMEPTTSKVPPQFSAPKAKGSFEMRLGTYWLVRVGIVMLLTSLVFLGTYAYKNFIVHTGPGGKVAMLYLASAVLLGVGKWLSRKNQTEAVKNYAQVLFAGGLAAVYFTTYAAHYFEHLRIIDSPAVDGLLLLGWAGVMVWLADRTKSEVLALFAIGLAYYTSIITQIGLFTLYSNMVLTLAVVFFLVRNRWTTLSFVSVVATYGGFVFWRFYHHNLWSWDTRAGELSIGNLFLTGYWIAFTAATFFSCEGKLVSYKRASFTTLNNAAYFAMIVISMFHANHGNFWKFSLAFGALQLALSFLAHRVLLSEKATQNAYLCQGLTLVTVGLIAKFTGLELSLILAAETVILLVLGMRLNNRWLQAGSFITAILASGGAGFGMEKSQRELILGLAVSCFLLFCAVWSRNKSEETDREKLLAQPAFYTLLGLFVGFITMRYNVPHVWLTSVLALTTLVLTASYYLIRNREISLIGQVYLGFAVLSWMLNVMDKVAVNPWWNPAMIIACLLALGHWWQHQKAIQGMNNAGKILQGIYALGMMGVVFLWLEPHFTPQHWLAFTSLLAVGITGYGIITRAWFLASCGQLFMWISVWEFVRQMSSSEPTWLTALTPIMTLIGTAMAVSAWLEVAGKSTREINKAVNSVGTLYRVAAILMALWWVLNYIPAREQIWVFCAAGGVIFALAGWRKSQEALLFSMVFFASGWISLILVLLNNPQNALYWPNLLCIFLLAGLQRVARHWPNHYSVPRGVHPATMLTCGLTLWLYLSQWVTVVAQGHSYLTASWAGLALLIFATGFVLRERTYRWLGLIILAADLGRVVMFDVWKLETLYRILSFMALGIALLVLGFVYNKFQEKIKEWM